MFAVGKKVAMGVEPTILSYFYSNLKVLKDTISMGDQQGLTKIIF